MGKGSKRRPSKVDQKIIESNWDRIFNKQKEEEIEDKDEKSEEEGSRELIRHQYTESYQPSKWGLSNYEERGLRDIEYSIQYNAPSENT